MCYEIALVILRLWLIRIRVDPLIQVGEKLFSTARVIAVFEVHFVICGVSDWFLFPCCFRSTSSCAVSKCGQYHGHIVHGPVDRRRAGDVRGSSSFQHDHSVIQYTFRHIAVRNSRLEVKHHVCDRGVGYLHE